jgi:hypothetical protein
MCTTRDPFGPIRPFMPSMPTETELCARHLTLLAQKLENIPPLIVGILV